MSVPHLVGGMKLLNWMLAGLAGIAVFASISALLVVQIYKRPHSKGQNTFLSSSTAKAATVQMSTKTVSNQNGEKVTGSVKVKMNSTKKEEATSISHAIETTRSTAIHHDTG